MVPLFFIFWLAFFLSFFTLILLLSVCLASKVLPRAALYSASPDMFGEFDCGDDAILEKPTRPQPHFRLCKEVEKCDPELSRSSLPEFTM